MLEALFVTDVLERSLDATEMLAFAVLNTDGVVLESRENPTKPSDLFPQSSAGDDFHVSSKLQTKIYGLFAAEFWSHNSGSQWIGAEAHERRLLVRPLKDDHLLLLTVGASSQTWGKISRCSESAASQLAQEIVKDE